MAQENVIVTGATSFIGSALIRKLLRQGFQVYAVVRKESTNIERLPKHPHLHKVWASLAEIDKVARELPEDSVFVHLGWDGVGSNGRQNPGIQSLNIQNSLKALETAKKINCRRFVFAGSQAEYGIYHQAVSETSLCMPISEYGKAKLEFGRRASEKCRDGKLEYIHLRIFSIYGADDHPWTLVKSCVEAFLTGNKIRLGPCKQLWNFLYIDDATEIMASIIGKKYALSPNGTIYNIAGNDTRPLIEFVQEIYDICGKKGSFVCGEGPEKAEGCAELIPDIEKISTVFDWKPSIDFNTGIRKIIAQRETEKR